MAIDWETPGGLVIEPTPFKDALFALLLVAITVLVLLAAFNFGRYYERRILLTPIDGIDQDDDEVSRPRITI